jgi:hypothetical protein
MNVKGELLKINQQERQGGERGFKHVIRVCVCVCLCVCVCVCV